MCSLQRKSYTSVLLVHMFRIITTRLATVFALNIAQAASPYPPRPYTYTYLYLSVFSICLFLSNNIRRIEYPCEIAKHRLPPCPRGSIRQLLFLSPANAGFMPRNSNPARVLCAVANQLAISTQDSRQLTILSTHALQLISRVISTLLAGCYRLFIPSLHIVR
jgi:hypothetical protein